MHKLQFWANNSIIRRPGGSKKGRMMITLRLNVTSKKEQDAEVKSLGLGCNTLHACRKDMNNGRHTNVLRRWMFQADYPLHIWHRVMSHSLVNFCRFMSVTLVSLYSSLQHLRNWNFFNTNFQQLCLLNLRRKFTKLRPGAILWQAAVDIQHEY